MWRQLSIMGVITLLLGGCASWSNAPPSCDGMARRPLNRSLWDWESGTPLAGREAPPPPSPPVIRKGDAGSTLPPDSVAASRDSSRQIDIAASYPPCGKET
ncbi:type IV secretion pathway protein [Bradyrhizobium sp. LHD-71]|uniref:type IV secretion pathway protein n=1 Tax=Bradyrhizobium sp. LHD-71 TaxID=3072141 RepID=UPI00280CFDE9|nr:type IV secretion pathway protein [Bradyrhizobium sp. LHD-71]MDQ8727531.1 type IV secretion pathway protein [Bradyrhizobium sp. LHD-71]